MTIDPATELEIALALARNRNLMSEGGRTRAEVLEAPEDDEMTEAGFREGYGHG